MSDLDILEWNVHLAEIVDLKDSSILEREGLTNKRLFWDNFCIKESSALDPQINKFDDDLTLFQLVDLVKLFFG